MTTKKRHPEEALWRCLEGWAACYCTCSRSFETRASALLRMTVVFVETSGGRVLPKASGGIELDTVKAVAEAGVELISSGWITHSAPVLDLGLDIEIG